MGEQAALLMVDIVDSTGIGERLGDAASSALWSAHDRMARDLLHRFGGLEIDRSDGFLLLFEEVDSAVAYAREYHHGLARLEPPLRARAAIHAGPVVRRRNPSADVARGAKPLEIDGRAKPLAARVMSIARPGQTLVTSAVLDWAAQAGQQTSACGSWQFQGVADPVALSELAGAEGFLGMPDDSAKAHAVVPVDGHWMPRRESQRSLPPRHDRFVDRCEPMQQALALIDAGARLVTIVGPGGVGKTRLAIECAWRLLGRMAGGAWFCGLAEARTGDGIEFGVARALDVPLGRDPLHQLGAAIAGRGRAAFVFDNLEQVVEAAATRVSAWLEQTRDAIFIVTSREALGVQGERVLRLGPLATDEGVVLLEDRAADGGAAPQGGRSALQQVVQLLDGLPLAIELAAARLRVMQPEALLARLDQRFRLLAARRGRVERQATLQATFDWSWELLDADEKQALAQCSVFAGGFGLEAAEAVIRAGAASWPVDLVQSLVDKSLLRSVADGRFDMLETLREYAAEKLREQGEAVVRATEQRHGEHYARLAQREDEPAQLAEMANVVVSARRATARRDAVAAARATLLAWRMLQMRGPYRLGLALATEVLALDLPDVLRGRLEIVKGRALLLSGDGATARSPVVHGLARLRADGDTEWIARAHASLAEIDLFEAQSESALSNYGLALASARELGDPSLICIALNGLGIVFNNLGRLVEARATFEQALAAARGSGRLRWESAAVGNLGQLLARLGQADEAMVLLAQAVHSARASGDRLWEGNMLCNLGLLQHERHDEVEAARHLESALVIARELGYPRLESLVLCNLGLVHQALDQLERARSEYESAVAIARERKDRLCEGQFLGYLGVLQTRAREFGIARATLTAAEQALRDVGDRVSLAIALCGRAELEAACGDMAAAETCLAEAGRIALESGVEPASELGAALTSTRAAVVGASI